MRRRPLPRSRIRATAWASGAQAGTAPKVKAATNAGPIWRRIGAFELDRIERVRSNEAACFLDLRRQLISPNDALNGYERVGFLVAGRHDCLAEQGEQAYLAIDGAPVAL